MFLYGMPPVHSAADSCPRACPGVYQAPVNLILKEPIKEENPSLSRGDIEPGPETLNGHELFI